MTWDDYYASLLALTAWREARGEGREGMRAVMHVIRNRVVAAPSSIDYGHVITKKWQFSSMTATGDGELVDWPNRPDPAFQLAMDLVPSVMDGSDPDITNGALYYYNPATATSQWFKDNIADKMPKVATIGHHEFFTPKSMAVTN